MYILLFNAIYKFKNIVITNLLLISLLLIMDGIYEYIIFINYSITFLIIVTIVSLLFLHLENKIININVMNNYNASIEVNYKNQKINSELLIDSGNLLHYHGMPVVFINNKKIIGEKKIEFNVVGGLKKLKGVICNCEIFHNKKIINKDCFIIHDSTIKKLGIIGLNVFKFN